MTKSAVQLQKYNNAELQLVKLVKANKTTCDQMQVSAHQHICDSILELHRATRRENLVFLSTILEMAYHEAFMIVNRITPAPLEAEEVERISEMGCSWIKQTLKPKNLTKSSA